MSEHITHIAVFEDGARLALELDGFSEAVKESLRARWDSGLLTSASRGNHVLAVPLMEEARAAWPGRDGSGEVEAHVAAAVGWCLHRAADHQMKPLSGALEEALEAGVPNPLGLSSTEYQIYQDAVTFREVYDGGRVQPGTPYAPLAPATLEPGMASHPGAQALAVEQAEPLLAAHVQGALMALHAFNEAGHDDLDAWLETFFKREQDFSEDLRVYVEAFQNPDPLKMVRYIDEVHWYDAGDPIIRWARALQRGAEPPGIPLEEAAEMARTQSQYAQALHKGLRYAGAASDFFEGRIDKTAFYDALHIWEGHRR